ncbi:MAG: hypothetical protein NW226_05295 [Microscillaceae bacterium]|nr:hypothetical protein [Microscillaceae bacterium]
MKKTDNNDNFSIEDDTHVILIDNLLIKGIIESYKAIEEEKKKKSNEILFSVGGNLDFLETVKISGLYYDINFFLPQAFPAKQKVFGLEARLNQGRFISRDTTTLTREQTREFYLNDLKDDSVSQVTQRYIYDREDKVNYLTLSLSPTFRLGSESSSSYLVIHSEVLRKTTTTNISYNNFVADTIIVKNDPAFRSTPPITDKQFSI